MEMINNKLWNNRFFERSNYRAYNFRINEIWYSVERVGLPIRAETSYLLFVRDWCHEYYKIRPTIFRIVILL